VNHLRPWLVILAVIPLAWWLGAFTHFLVATAYLGEWPTFSNSFGVRFPLLIGLPFVGLSTSAALITATALLSHRVGVRSVAGTAGILLLIGVALLAIDPWGVNS